MMIKTEVVQRMREISFFEDMTEEELTNLAKTPGALVKFKAADILLQQGMKEDAFFVLLDGRLSVTRNKPPEIFLSQLAPGSIFGELTLKSDRRRTSSVTADEEGICLRANLKLFENISPVLLNKFKDQIIKLLLVRLDELRASKK